jgi:type IV secretory pathway VirB2 component (pilin)
MQIVLGPLILLSSVLEPVSLVVGELLLQAGGGNAISQFLTNLYNNILRPVALAAAILFGAFGGLQIIMGRREGVEKVVFAVVGLFVILAAGPLFQLVQNAVPGA